MLNLVSLVLVALTWLKPCETCPGGGPGELVRGIFFPLGTGAVLLKAAVGCLAEGSQDAPAIAKNHRVHKEKNGQPLLEARHVFRMGVILEGVDFADFRETGERTTTWPRMERSPNFSLNRYRST